MLLSGFNLIKNKSCGNHEFSDFILGKIKEEQDRRDKKCLGKIPYLTKQKKCLKIDDQDLLEEKENVENEKKLLTTGEVVKPSSKNEEISHVSIETKDGYYLAINKDRNILFLSGEEELTKSSVFCQRTFKTKKSDIDDKNQHLVVFQLQCDPYYFITTTDERKLDVVKYEDVSLNPDCPDNRFFVLHQLDNGSVFIQPYLHKGYYIHHIDNNLFLRKLEINWRPPEEYFFKVEVVDLPELDITDCEMDTISEIFSTEINNNNKKQNSEKQLIDVDIPKTPKQSLIFGCFGSRTKKHFSNKKNKR